MEFDVYIKWHLLNYITDTAELKEPEKVRASQEKALQALQAYTLGEFVKRDPELDFITT